MNDKKRCDGFLLGGFGWERTRCTSRASLEHEGKHYCKTHHPPTIQAKNEAKHEKWRVKWEAKAEATERANALAKERDRRAALFPELLEALRNAHKALDAIAAEMTVGDRYTNAGQYLIDALPEVRAAIAKATVEQP